MNSSSIVLLSGGVDSLVCASQEHRAGRLLACLFVQYGQPAGEPEYAAARRWCSTWEVPLRRIDMAPSGMEAMTAPSGAEGPRVVPGRNLILIAHAANLAVSVGAGRVIYGATASDRADYPDCGPAFLTAVDAACRASGVAVEAPLMNLSKAAVLEQARRLGISLKEAWSCYAPRRVEGEGFVPCGACNSCVARAVG